MPIHLLSPSVVNRIAAGEVIERPASVVKELVENAVDAGATRVDVALEQGGSELVRVTDDGCGISAGELPLAVTNHATSKISTADELFQVATLGFRGEALASIAEVSRLTLRSRTAEAAAGAELRVIGGAAQAIEPAGCPVGTTIEIGQLFFNTPVRQKFLRSPQTEMGHAAEAFIRVALGHPRVHFRLTHGGRTVHDLPPATNWQVRIGQLFGSEIAETLIEIDSHDGPVRLSGFAANPMHSRANNRLQYLFLNGRAIRDRSLQHALGEAYRGLLLTGRQPICFLRLDMPPAQVDVNVHPTKLEVRFQDAGRLYSQLLGTLRTKFLTTDLKALARGPIDPVGSSSDDELAAATNGASQLVDWVKGQLSQQRMPMDGPAPMRPHFESNIPLTLHQLPGSEPVAPTAYRYDAPHGGDGKAIQLHNRYLVVETEGGMEVIDQHALHERILYEQIRDKVLSHGLETQKLLVPEPVDLSAQEAAVAQENSELLAKLGVEVQPFGGETVLVSSYPAMLANLPPAEVLRELIERLIAGGVSPDPHEILDDLLHTIACKAAVKYGDRLAPEEIDALLAQRHVTENHHHCPHGRPTALVFTCEELDKQFKRI